MGWKITALASILIFWLSMYILLTHWPREANKSISRHAAANRNTYLFFTPVQVVIGIIMLIFMLRWFMPTFQTGLLFNWVFVTTATLQITSALLPDRIHGVKSNIHLVMANSMATGMFLSTVLLLLNEHIHIAGRLALLGTSIFMLYTLGLAIKNNGKPELIANYLALQITYIVLFQSSVLVATFLR